MVNQSLAMANNDAAVMKTLYMHYRLVAHAPLIGGYGHLLPFFLLPPSPAYLPCISEGGREFMVPEVEAKFSLAQDPLLMKSLLINFRKKI